MLTIFGASAVAAMLVRYALEARSSRVVFAFGLSCIGASGAAWLMGAWPPASAKDCGASSPCAAGSGYAPPMAQSPTRSVAFRAAYAGRRVVAVPPAYTNQRRPGCGRMCGKAYQSAGAPVRSAAYAVIETTTPPRIESGPGSPFREAWRWPCRRTEHHPLGSVNAMYGQLAARAQRRWPCPRTPRASRRRWGVSGRDQA